MAGLNLSYLLSKKLIPKNGRQISRPIMVISVVSVALGVCILILAFAITNGFKNEIKSKIVGFGAHIEIVNFDNNNSYESVPIRNDFDFYDDIRTLENVQSIQSVAAKAGIANGEEDIEGIVFKGIGKDYNPSFFEKYLTKGRFIQLPDSTASNEIIISETLANKLHLDTGQRLLAYFVQQPVRQRMFTITGIYNTGLGTHDKNTIITDIRQIQRLNDWNKNLVSGVEILIKNFDKIDQTNDQINDILPPDMQSNTVIERNREVFDWINLFNQNVYILILLIVIITSVSLISTQLTISLEHINTIGILKTLGCTNTIIRNIFLYISVRILGFGLLFGNIAALIICYLQHNFNIITLDAANYFVSFVPIGLDLRHVLLVNLGTIFISIAILIIPSYFVAVKTKTIDALRME